MGLPVRSGRITAVFGPTSEPLDSGGFNKGVDIGVAVGTPFEIIVGGTVVHAGPGSDGWGISVKVRDANGIIHNYGHLSEVSVQVGDEVTPGTLGGKTGNTGASTGPHLSYDTYDVSGRAVDPSPYLGFNAIGDNRDPGSTIIGADVGQLGGREPSVEDAEYWEKRRRYGELSSQYGLWLENPELARELKMPQPPPEIVQELLFLDAELADYEDTYGAGGVSVSDIKNAYDLYNSGDPRAMDAANAANRYDREYGTRVDAANLASDALKLQLDSIKEATDSQQAMIDSAAGGKPRLAGALALPAKVLSGDELFASTLKRLTDALPAVPDSPYLARPAGGPEDILRRAQQGGIPPAPPKTPQSLAQRGALSFPQMAASASNTVAESDTVGNLGITIAQPGAATRSNFAGTSQPALVTIGGNPQPGSTSQSASPDEIRGSIFNKKARDFGINSLLGRLR